MKAMEARQKSVVNAAAIAAKEVADRRKKRISNIESAKRNHEKFYQVFLSSLEYSIKSAVEDGRRSVTRTLSSDHYDCTYHDGSYRGTHYVEGELYGESNFFKRAKYKKEIKRVIAKLRRDGYKIAIEGKCVEHDESAAYLNSGGECGSETPYYTHDTVMTISW